MDIRQRMGDEKCGDRDDVRTHFSKLQKYKEDLAALGSIIEEKDYVEIIQRSIPSSYNALMSSIHGAR